MHISGQLGAAATWEDIAVALDVQASEIRLIKVNCNAHRLLFRQIQFQHPNTTLKDIKEILETKMSKPRRDIFFKQGREYDLPPLDRKFGSMDENDIMLVFKNVADKLEKRPVSGHWRHLGGHLGFKPTELDEIEEAGKPNNFASPGRIFINHLATTEITIKEFIDALKKVKRYDVLIELKKLLDAGDCWVNC